MSVSDPDPLRDLLAEYRRLRVDRWDAPHAHRQAVRIADYLLDEMDRTSQREAGQVGQGSSHGSLLGYSNEGGARESF